MSRNMVCGFDSIEDIPALEQQEIMVDIKKGFHPKRLIIGPSIACSFEIIQIKIGDEDQITIGGNALPGELFLATASPELVLDEADKGEVITLIVKNLSAGALRFTGAILGPLLVPEKTRDERPALFDGAELNALEALEGKSPAEVSEFIKKLSKEVGETDA